ncbi:Scr1 family TA system antitoxin-like transcriptional regulator [Actinocorallia populi]|uniref:Scr1 family TA system antitoxin-like transcriptional regulator n=1 Tax=Actinocorallia populi TaxID=2079200 RepID=UPI000D090C6D|nr:Scr1 family TA system antitoxin-like transcriptional regulator [Actinocorallia populi]
MPTTKERADEAASILAARLRQLLAESPLNTISLAAEVGWAKSKVSKIQNGVQIPTERDIRVWCTATGNPESVPDLIAAVRNIDDLYIQWRRIEQTGLRRVQESFNPQYEGTSEFRIFQHSPIPSLLQTPAYAKAHLTSIMEFREVPNDVDAATEERLKLQQHLADGTKRFSFVVSEAALYAPMLDEEGMLEQLDRLLHFVGGQVNVSLGILPLRAPRTVWPWEGFWIYDADEVRPDLVAGQIRNRQPADVAHYLKTFEHLVEASAYGRTAQNLIEAAKP